MKNLIKIEELFLFVLALFLFSGLDYGWACRRSCLVIPASTASSAID
jgi:hypothetical protein